MATDKIEEALGLIAFLAFLIVPFLRITVGFVLVAFPDATVWQQVFVWTMISAILLITVSGAFIVWVLGIVLVAAEALVFIWNLLG